MSKLRTLLRPTVLWPALVVVAALLYLCGLGSMYAPTNGDEMVYLHIARMTAESGHWLPLQSELLGTRNTKPPLLIWQAMVAGGWGHWWNLFAIRLPSVLYTFATTAMVAWVAWRMTRAQRSACIAALLYLCFFSSFRYGRVYLTSAPETFWLSVPVFWILWLLLRPPSIQPGHVPVVADPTALSWPTYTLFGVAMGLGAAYKSFALVAPAAATVWGALMLLQRPLTLQKSVRLTLGVTWSTVLGVAIFALWFAIDPDPGAVWQEFVVAENAGKMSNAQGYWQAALFGAYPMWTQLLAYPENAAVLALPVLGFLWLALNAAFKRRSFLRLSPASKVLLVWLVVWLVVFTIPSQRSARYVIPAMPALAIAMALAWERIARWGFACTLLICAPALVMLGRIGFVMGEMGIASNVQVALLLLMAAVGLGAITAGLLRGRWTRTATLIACLAVYASFGQMVAPLDNAEVNYAPASVTAMSGQRIAVPNGFTGQYERFHFVFPQAKLTPFDAEGRKTGALFPEMEPKARLNLLLGQFDAVVWLEVDSLKTDPVCAPACQVLGQRWHVKSRHKEGEVTLANLWQPQQWLFGREWLVTRRP
jgi:4-amino-4-deoxy-L-arabinose transferase-like glycosyltransferase